MRKQKEGSWKTWSKYLLLGKECDRLKMGKGLTIQTFVLQVVGISIPVVARALVKGLFFSESIPIFCASVARSL